MNSSETQSDIDLREKVKELERSNELSLLKENKIKCIKKTLIVTYGISKWEAHYYATIINDFSSQYKIPWEIYAAIIRIESNFNGTLVSVKKAKGLMQILESTGKDEARIIGMDYVEGQTLWNDVSNLVLGCNYLSRMIKNSDLEHGVKSYLGGPSYMVSIRGNKEIAQYVSEYKTNVWQEYRKLCFIFKGIVSDSNLDYYKIHEISNEMLVKNDDLFVQNLIKDDPVDTLEFVDTLIKK